MAKRSRDFEVAIVGAGPSGATSAIKLAGLGHRVALIDTVASPRKATSTAWMSAQAKPLLDALGVSVKKLAGRTVNSVTFYNADLSQSARPNFVEPPGMVLDRSRFRRELVRTARKSGATLLDGCRVTEVVLEEEAVSLMADEADPIRSRLLIVAAGQGSPLLARFEHGAGASSAASWIAQVNAEVSGYKGGPAMGVVLGIDAASSFGWFIRMDDRLSVGVHITQDEATVARRLAALCRELADVKIVEADLSDMAADAGVHGSPCGVALSRESHVAKHTLIVGDAGGFVSAASGEGIYPAMWSASIAADVISEALGSANPQDRLREFDSRWRGALADYLRAPNTDMQYLVPLIFTNQPMADRMGAAFFSGENI